MADKNYRSSTGVTDFHYGVVGDGTTADEIERIKFLQTITVEMPQEPVRAYGDNTVAEIAVSNGDISVSGSFHKLPMEDKQVLLGMETVDGISAVGSTDNPPYVGVVFAKTHEDGSSEYVGLPKGIFTRPQIEGNTKEDSVEFSSDEIEAAFMDREVDGFTDNKSVLFGVDEKGETTNRDAIFQKVFGKGYPGDDDGDDDGEDTP